MQAKDIMTATVLTAKATDSLESVAALIIKHRFNGVPIVDESNKLLGLIAERDFIAEGSDIYLPTYIKMIEELEVFKRDRDQLPKEVTEILHSTAADVMEKNVATVSPETELKDLATLFATKRVNPVPVVDKAGKLVGIIARSDLIKLFSAQMLLNKNDEKN
jgi:CBS-domain-containing membrane protein